MQVPVNGLHRQLLIHAANDKQFNPNKIIFSPPSGYVPQHDGVDNAPVFTLQKPIGIFVPMKQKNEKPKGVKNTFFSMFSRKANGNE